MKLTTTRRRGDRPPLPGSPSKLNSVVLLRQNAYGTREAEARVDKLLGIDGGRAVRASGEQGARVWFIPALASLVLVEAGRLVHIERPSSSSSALVLAPCGWGCLRESCASDRRFTAWLCRAMRKKGTCSRNKLEAGSWHYVK